MRDFLYGLKNLVFYFKTIWQDRPWDYLFILKLLDKKLEQIELHRKDKYFGVFGKHIDFEGEEKILKRLIEIREQIQIIVEEKCYMEKEEGAKLFRKLGRLLPYLWD